MKWRPLLSRSGASSALKSALGEPTAQEFHREVVCLTNLKTIPAKIGEDSQRRLETTTGVRSCQKKKKKTPRGLESAVDLPSCQREMLASGCTGPNGTGLFRNFIRRPDWTGKGRT